MKRGMRTERSEKGGLETCTFHGNGAWQVPGETEAAMMIQSDASLSLGYGSGVEIGRPAGQRRESKGGKERRKKKGN